MVHNSILASDQKIQETPQEADFYRGTLLFKALSDETRVRIMHILSCGELCACEILKYFDISQPTLSHHLAILSESGLVETRKEGKWIHYRIHPRTARELHDFFKLLTEPTHTCLCKTRTPQGDLSC